MLSNALDIIGRRDIGRVLEVVLPLQSHLTPLPLKQKKKPNDICIRSDEGLKLETSAF